MMAEVVSPDMLAILAGALYILGCLVINQVILRLFVLVGTGVYIWYYYIAADSPLWEAIYISVMIGVANIIGLTSLLLYNSRILLPRRDRDLYGRFGDLPPGDFRTLMRLADRVILTEERALTHEGEPLAHLYFAVEGAMDIEKRGERFVIPDNTFVGEVAYLTRQTASATTWARPGAELLVWDAETLRKRAARQPRFKLSLGSILSKDLAMKVAFAVAPKNPDWDRARQMRAMAESRA